MVSLPPIVHDALGKEASEELARWIDLRIREQGIPRDEYREVLSRLDLVEHDLEGVKTELRALRREMDERFDRMSAQFNERFDHMSTQFDDRLDRMGTQFDDRLDRMGTQFDERLDRMGVQFDERLNRTSTQLDDRLDRMSAQFDERLDRMSIQFDERFDRLSIDINRRMDRMEERMASTTRWTVSTIALFGTIITILLAISQFSP